MNVDEEDEGEGFPLETDAERLESYMDKLAVWQSTALIDGRAPVQSSKKVTKMEDRHWTQAFGEDVADSLYVFAFYTFISWQPILIFNKALDLRAYYRMIVHFYDPRSPLALCSRTWATRMRRRSFSTAVTVLLVIVDYIQDFNQGQGHSHCHLEDSCLPECASQLKPPRSARRRRETPEGELY